jgi:phage gp45-like
MSGFYNGYTFSPKLNFSASSDSTSPAVTTSINYNTIDGYVKPDVPILFPYGFISIPSDNANCIYLGTSAYNAIGISGYTNSLAKNSNMSGMVKGESGIFSEGNFTLKAKLDALISTFTNNAETVINTTLPISENIVKILIDIINEIRFLETNYNALITTFNNFNTAFLAHVHGGVTTGGGSTTGTVTNFPNNPAYVASGPFDNDYTFINQSPSRMYINISGEVLT